MKTTINLSDELMEQAAKYTGIQEKTKLVHLALETLIKESFKSNYKAWQAVYLVGTKDN